MGEIGFFDDDGLELIFRICVKLMPDKLDALLLSVLTAVLNLEVSLVIVSVSYVTMMGKFMIMLDLIRMNEK